MAKFLAKSLKPLMGHTSSYIKDSAHFIEGFKDLRLDNNDLLVSFDVVSLYTKVPNDDAISIIKDITNYDTTKLIDIYLRLAYFSFRGDLYEQVDGVAIGLATLPNSGESIHGIFWGKSIKLLPYQAKNVEDIRWWYKHYLATWKRKPWYFPGALEQPIWSYKIHNGSRGEQ